MADELNRQELARIKAGRTPSYQGPTYVPPPHGSGSTMTEAPHSGSASGNPPPAAHGRRLTPEQMREITGE